MSSHDLAPLLPLPVVILIAGATVSPLLARISAKAPMVVSLLATTAATVVLALFAKPVYAGEVFAHFLGNWGPVHGSALGITFSVDAFGLTFALLSSTLGGVLLLYSLSELGGLGAKELGAYACLVQLLLAALIGSALTADMVNLFVWFEVAALASYGLTGFFLERPWALEAAFKIMVLTNVGAFCVFVATSLLYAGHGALNLGQMHLALTGDLRTADLVALGLIVAGFGTKAGIISFHGWLPDAHTAAPGPVSALFSGLMVNLGIVAIARICLDVYPLGRTHVLACLTVLGALSAVVGALLALAQDDLKRLLAYDTVSQMGVLLAAVGTGTYQAMTGMAYHLINHALYKTLLFLCAGAIVHATGMTRLSQMGGLARHRPVVTVAFLLGAGSIAGIPPLNGYASLGLIHDALRSHPATFIAILLAQVITIAALARATYLAFFRRRDDDYDPLERMRPGMLVAFCSLGLACIGFGVVPDLVLSRVVAPAAEILTHPSVYADAAMTGAAHVGSRHETFPYFAPDELLITVGCLALGLLLARWYVRRDHEPSLVTWLRRLHTGSVNDYVGYSVLGLVLTTTVLLVR